MLSLELVEVLTELLVDVVAPASWSVPVVLSLEDVEELLELLVLIVAPVSSVLLDVLSLELNVVLEVD